MTGPQASTCTKDQLKSAITELERRHKDCGLFPEELNLLYYFRAMLKIRFVENGK